MQEQELETLLHHLGQDIGYMGHRVQKDVQKCLKDLKATHDKERFCNKLAGILKEFSEYTIQYSKDLEGRIKEYNKEEEYRNITKKLEEITTKTFTCHTCKIKERVVESLNSLVSPSNSNADGDSTKYYLENEVLSQHSLHIGDADEIKSEQSTQTHSPDVHSEGIPTSTTNDLTNEERRPTQQEPEILSIHAMEQEDENHHAGNFDNDSDFANSLEISHSEEIQSVEDEPEVTVGISAEEVTPDIVKSKTLQSNVSTVDTVEKPPIPLPYEPIFEKDENVNLDNAVDFHDSDKSQKIDVIALPYKPLFEKDKSMEESADAPVISVSEEVENPSLCLSNVTGHHDFNELPKLDVIALPYTPYWEQEKHTEESGDSDAVCLEDPISILSIGAKSSSLKENGLEEKNTSSMHNDAKWLNLSVASPEHRKGNIAELHTDEIDDSDTEIVSVASSIVENDSDIEIIENIPTIINISDPACASNNNSQSTKKELNSDAETVKNTSPLKEEVVLGTLSQKHSSEGIVARASIIESESTEEILDSDDAESVEYSAPLAAVVLGTLSQGHPSEESVVASPNINKSHSTEEDIHSDAKTVGHVLMPKVVENAEEIKGLNTDTVANVSPADHNATLEQHSGLANSEVTGADSQQGADEDLIESERNYSEDTVGNRFCSAEAGENDSEETIIASPLDEAALLDREENYKNGDTPNVTQDSDGDDIYSKTTQKSSTVAQKDCTSVVDDDGKDMDTTTHLESSAKNHSKSKDNSSDCAIADIETQNDKAVVGNDGLTGEMSDTAEESPDEATQEIEIPQTEPDIGSEDVVMEVQEDDMLSQESYVFDLASAQDSEEIVQTQLPENDGIAEVGSVNEENDSNKILERENNQVLSPQVVASDSTTLTVKDTVAIPDNENENMSECGDINDDGNLSISERSESVSSSFSHNLESTSPKTQKKLKEKDRKSLLKVIAEYFLKRTREKAAMKNEKDNKENNKKESKKKKLTGTSINQDSDKTKEQAKESIKSSSENSNNSEEIFRSSKNALPVQSEVVCATAGPVQSFSNFINQLPLKCGDGSSNNKDSRDLDDGLEDPDMTQKVDNIRKLREVSSDEIRDNVFDQATQNASSKNSTAHVPTDNGNKVVVNQASNEENDVDSHLVSPFKRKTVRPLPTTQSDEEEGINENDVDSHLVSPFKRKTVRPLPTTQSDEEEGINENDVDSHLVSPFKRKTVRPLPTTQSDEEEGINENDVDSQVVSPFKRKTVKPLPTTQSDEEEAEEDDQVVSPFKKKGVKRLHASDESDSEPPKKIPEVDESDILDPSEIIQPFKRKRINRLESTDIDESELVKGTSEEESDVVHGPKRKRVSSSEQNSTEEVDIGQNDDQEMSEEKEREIEPSQFKLDDKARDELLDLFDQPAEDLKSSDREGIEEPTHEIDRDADSENESENMLGEASQFRLSNCDRDNLLNLLTDKENDERMRDQVQRDPCHSNVESKERNEQQDMLNGSRNSSENNSANGEPINTLHAESNENHENSHNGGTNMPSQFKLDSKARDEFLDLLNSAPPTDLEAMQDENEKKEAKTNSSEEKRSSEEDNLIRNGDKQDECIAPSQFQLTSADRDELLEMLTNKQIDDLKAEEHKQVNNSEMNRVHKPEEGDPDHDDNDPSQFKLNDKARDDFLVMLNGDQSDESGNKCEEKESSSNDNTDRPKATSDSTTDSKENNDENTLSDEDVDDNGEDENGDEDDGIDDTATENSQGIDDVDESEADSDEEQIEDRDDEIDDEDSAAFQLDDSERDELLVLLSDHINQSEMAGPESNSDTASDQEIENGISKKNERKSKMVDRDMLLELLQEYESAVTRTGNGLVEIVKNGDMEFANMDSENENANSDFGEDSAGDSESVLMDLLREEPVEGPRRKKFRNMSKEAWKVYRELLKDKEELSDTSSELSDIDTEDFELNFSDQERKQKQRAVNDQLRKKFNIDKELIVNVDQVDISKFDVTLPRRGHNSSIDRLCDISNVLQKRKKAERKRQKGKLKRILPPVSSSESDRSDAESVDSLSSSSTRWSENSLRASQDSASSRYSPFLHLSDDNAEQEKLANTLWENIKNSSDENSGWSSDTDIGTSDDEVGKKKGKGGSGGGKKKKEKKVDGEDKNGSGDDTNSEKSGSENSDTNEDESGDREETKDDKDADLDSSDEEDFVGARKSKGAWKRDPLLKSCFTSDENSDSDSGADAKTKKARSWVRFRKRFKRKEASNNRLDVEQDGTKTPTEEIDDSTDSDVEFIMEKQKTPNKLIEIDDEVEDDSPSKRGAGRRNIRALVEDDELEEATKKAKKEEADRIKRLQERERAKETFTQSQSLGSQLSEDECDPLILDVNEDLQIKVHAKLTRKLKPHQRIGIQFMWDSCYESVEQLKKEYEGSGCILAHCMGLGKTLQALALIHTLFNYKEISKTKHVLVVCPLSTVSNWRNEFKLAYKDIKRCNVKLYTIQDKKGPNQKCKIVGDWWRTGGVLVMGYECFGIMINDQKWEKWGKIAGHCEKKDVLKALVNPGPDLVICDEGHLLRNKQTQRSLALNRIETKRRIVLTGTPLQNNLLEYYYMVNFVKPNLLGTEKEYKTNFINPISNGQFENSTAIDIFVMKKRTHVLHKILNKTVQRVEDTELKKYLPELVDQALFVKLSDLQIGFYNTYLDSANSRPVEYTAAGNISRKNFLADIQILRYICTHPDVVTIAKSSVKSRAREEDVIDDDDNIDDGVEAKVFSKGSWYKDLVPESGVKKLELGTKMMVTLGIVQEAITNDDKVLIFSQTHAEMDCLEFFLAQELNYKKGVDYNRMDGTISPEVRTHMCDKFNNKHNKKLRVFIMSTKVGGLGLNLTAASRVILMNVNWNPSYDTQSVFRAFRFGQNKAVYVYRLIALDTMEEKMYQRQVTKLAVAHRVVDKHQITRHYSAADIQEFYSARPSVERERPLPNVPEDRVLAKLIQKYQFLYKWHEHQALLANRPEEDLNEQQKNSAWEEFNKKAVEPPPPLPPLQPQFVSVGHLLNAPGPSGLQNINMAHPRPSKPRARRSKRLNNVADPLLAQAMATYLVPNNIVPNKIRIKQTESGPKLVIQAHGSVPEKEIPLQLGFSPSTSVTTRRDDDAARKIREINSLVSAQTTSELVSGFNTTTANSSVTASTADVHSSRIDEINSLTSAILSQHDNVSGSTSQEWADDGMNAALLNLNLPETEDSASGHFADHSYSLPKTKLLTFTPSVEDFLPMPSPKFTKIPFSLFVDVNAPLDLDPITTPINKLKKYRIYKRYPPIMNQRINSADDFRTTTQPKYVPRPVFVDVQAPLGPRPNLSGINPPLGQKQRPSTISKPVQIQISTKPVQSQPIASLAHPSAPPPHQVRLGNAITITHNNGTRPNPPPAHAQKPSISIIPQPASTRTISNTTAATKPPPYVPKSGASVVQNPVNLVSNRQIVNKKQATRNGAWAQKDKNKLNNGTATDLVKSKQMANSAQNVVTTLSPKIVVAPPLRISTAPPPPLVKPLTRNASSPLFTRPPVPASTSASDPAPVSTTTATTATPTQQSPLQKQMRNFMEHLHHLQLRMKPTEADESSNLGDSNWGQVWNPTGTNKGAPANINTDPLTRHNVVGGTPSSTNPLPSRTIVRVGSKALSPVIGRPSTTSLVHGLNAARNLSNITKTYRKSQNNKVVGVPPLTTVSTSQSTAHHSRARLVGTHPPPNTSTVIMPINTGSNVTHTNGNSPRVVRKVITTNSPRSGTRNVVITPTGPATNGSVPRVITKVVGPKSMGTNVRVNPVGLPNGVPSEAARMIPGGTTISPVLAGQKKIVISHKEDTRQSPVSTNPSPIRFDLLQKKIVASLNKFSTKNVSPKQLPSALQGSLPSSLQRLPIQLPSAPQRSFINGANMKTYQAGRKNNPPSRSSSLPSLPQSTLVSKSNKENRAKRKLTFRTNNNNTSSASIDLSNDEENGNNSSAALPRDMVNTLKKKGVSVNYVGKGAINVD